MPRPTIPVAALSALLTASAFSQVVYLNDQFTDLDRTNQSLPTSAKWTYGAHNATAANAFTSLDASSGSLLWDHTTVVGATPANSFSAIWAHFANAGSPISLAVGETITLSFDVSFSNGVLAGSTGAFRFALLNSGGVRQTTDFAGANESGISSGTTFLNWRGYEGQTVVSTGGTNSSGFLTRERLGTGNGLFTTGTSPVNWATLTGSQTSDPAFTLGTTYQGFLTIGRTGSSATVQAGLAGAITNSVIDSSGSVINFDTVAFFVFDGNTNDIRLDNISVSVVPEPSSLSLLGVAALGLVRRRK